MNKENFLNEVVRRMYEVVDAEEITITRTEKKNGVVKSGITIKTKDSNVAPVIYLEDMFSQYEENAKTKDEIIGDLSEIYHSAKVSSSLGDEIGLFSFETSRSNLFIKMALH